MAVKEKKQASYLFSEQEKIFQERTGNTFEFYYNKFYPKLIYYTNKMCNDSQSAEDITTDSFITALEKIEMYHKDKAQFSTWLFTIAKNLTLMKIKENKKSISMDTEIDDNGCTLKDFIAEEESEVHVENANQEKYEIMMRHISKLKPQYRQIIEMREVKKMSYKDISDQLNICLSTTKSRIRTARQSLMKSVSKEFKLIDENLI